MLEGRTVGQCDGGPRAIFHRHVRGVRGEAFPGCADHPGGIVGEAAQHHGGLLGQVTDPKGGHAIDGVDFQEERVDLQLREGIGDGPERLRRLTRPGEGGTACGDLQRAEKVRAGGELHFLPRTDKEAAGGKVDPRDEVQPTVRRGQRGKTGGAPVGQGLHQAASKVIFRRRNWVALFET